MEGVTMIFFQAKSKFIERSTRFCLLSLVTSVIGILSISSVLAEEGQTSSRPSLIVVVGAYGTPQYEISFYQWSERWIAAAKKANVAVTVIGRHRGEGQGEKSDYDLFHEAVRAEEAKSSAELWIVLIGHGTYDRRVARFNLRGPDVSADELADWLQPIQRPTAIINCSSASGPFIPILSGPNRVVVSATKSGTEINFSRFGDYLSQAIDSPEADLDKDHQTSLWEAFLTASRKTTEYYDTEERVAAEHALLDDNGDRRGVRADQFRGLIAVVDSNDGAPLDGRKAHQWHLVPNEVDSKIPPEIRARRNEIELAIEQLRDRKQSTPKADYLTELERLLVELATLNEKYDQ